MARWVVRRRLRCLGAARLRPRIAIALTDDAMARIHEVAAACRALGFEHDSTLDDVGVLTGSAGVDDLPGLRTVPGVLAVATEQLPPVRGQSHHA